MFAKKPTTPDSIAAGFRRRAPWVTRFVIGGQAYGGAFDPEADARIPQFFQVFPNVRTILELGSLEGGQTFVLARRPGVQLTCVEARRFNIEKARFVQALLGTDNARFVHADLEKRQLSSFGKFDAIFCSGLLYHLPRPWELLDGLKAAAPRVFLWTQYADPAKVTDVINGFPGHWYQEHGQRDPLSGMSPKSYWITLPALVERLKRNGFDSVRILEDNPGHPNGPSVTLAAWAGDA